MTRVPFGFKVTRVVRSLVAITRRITLKVND